MNDNGNAPLDPEEVDYLEEYRNSPYSKPAAVPTPPKLSFMDYASPAAQAVLAAMRPARLPGRKHEAANVLSALGQVYFGGRANQARDAQARYGDRMKLATDHNERIAGFKERAALRSADNRMMLERDKQQEMLIRGRPATPPRERDPDLAEGTRLINEERVRRARAEAQQATDDEAIKEEYASNVASFRIKPTDIPKRDPRWNADIQNRANAKLAAAGSKYSLQQLEQLWVSTKKWTETSNAQRAINTRKAAMTVLDHIHQFESEVDRYRESYDNLPWLKKQELKLANVGVYGAMKNGVFGPEATGSANALETIVSILPTEYATVLSGGFAPQKEQLADAAKVFSPAMGPEGHKGRLRALKRLVKARVDNEQRNFNIIGGEDNPFLMEISKLEGWDLSKEPADFVSGENQRKKPKFDKEDL